MRKTLHQIKTHNMKGKLPLAVHLLEHSNFVFELLMFSQHLEIQGLTVTYLFIRLERHTVTYPNIES